LLYAAASEAAPLAGNVTILFVIGSDVEAKTASFSAAAADAADGATKAPSAFWTAAVGRFQATPNGAPVQSEATGKIAPIVILVGTLPGAPVVWFKSMSFPRTASSPPVTVVWANGQFSVGVVLVVFAPPASCKSPAAKAASDASVLSRRFSTASFSMVGSKLPHLVMGSAAGSQVEVARPGSSQAAYCF
jgi:hypothetical protein